MARPRRELHVLEMLRTQSIYDCFDITELEYNIRIFGAANVGNLFLTNLMVPGMLATAEQTFFVQRWYARTNIPDTGPLREALHVWANGCSCTFVMGEQPQWTLSLYELLERRPRTGSDEARPNQITAGDPWPIIVPQRQSVTVQCDSFQGTALERLRSLCADSPLFGPGETRPRVWIHFEGLRCHTEEGIDHLIDAIAARDDARRPIEEEIASWLTRTAAKDDASQAQAQALADGIMEGRHRQ